MDLTDLPLPSRSNVFTEAQDAAASTSATPFAEPPTIAAPKSKAQKQREYRQRMAASRTPAEVIAARKSDAERQRNYRLGKNANSALVSGSLESTPASSSHYNDVQTDTQRQLTLQQYQTSAAERQKLREYRQRIAASRTSAQAIAARKSDAERQRNHRLGKAASSALVSGSLESTPASSSHSNDVQTGTQRQLTHQQCQTPAAVLQKQREYKQRIAASRTPEQALAARKLNAERQRNCRLRKAANSALVSGSLETTTASSFRSGARSNDVQTGTQRHLTHQKRQTSAAEPEQITVQPAYNKTLSQKDMDLPNPESAFIKVEPGSQEEDRGETWYPHTDFDFQTVKKECWKYSETTPTDIYKKTSSQKAMGLPNPESTSIKVEPGPQEDGGGETWYTDIDFDLHYIKKERLQYSETSPTNTYNNTLSQKAMDLPNPESVSIKVEPGSQEEGGGEMRYTDINFDFQDVKKEYLKHSETTPTDSGIIVETVPMKAEPGLRDEDGGKIPNTEIDINFPGVKKECLERSERTTLAADILKNPKTHSGQKRYSCSNCNYSCPGRLSFKLHKCFHTAVKHLSCSDCNYKSSRLSDLRRHMLTHSGAKPFSCSVCNYSFSQKEHLKKHMLTHSGEKPFSCLTCGFLFSGKMDLARHMQTHGGVKPFLCSDCNYSCFQKANLKTHMMKHSGEKPFSCSLCTYSAARKTSLNNHITRTHLQNRHLETNHYES